MCGLRSEFYNILVEIQKDTAVQQFLFDESQVVPQQVIDYRNYLNKEVLSKTNFCS